MLFSSIVFIYLFLPIVLVFYYGVFRKHRSLQNIFLFLASLVFYAWGEKQLVLVMLLSIVVNWLAGILVDRFKSNKSVQKGIVICDIVFNLGLLFFFKYMNFTCGIIETLSGIQLNVPKIALPIGISFFTFQAMSYVVDVYKQRGEVQTNLINVGLYISLFPQLVAGPIVRYETIADEIKNRVETPDDFYDGFARFVVGLAKKVLLANYFAVLANQGFDNLHNGVTISVLMGWLGAIAYTLQIYFDFSGYSDMAIGLGRMFGFHFLENFDYPYVSLSVTEFWRRWHISLGSWFRDYVYIPLGGNRCSKSRNIFNLFAVWFLTGLWHGANYTFIVWGLMYFAILLIERQTGIVKRKGKALNIWKWLYTIFFVVIGWVIFRAESIGDAVNYIKTMFGLNGSQLTDGLFNGWFTQSYIMLIIGIILCTPISKTLSDSTNDNNVVSVLKVIGLCVLFVVSIASLVSSSYNPFIYFNF